MSYFFENGLHTINVLSKDADVGSNANGTNLLIDTGDGDGTGAGGNLTIQAGGSTGTGDSGNINITTENATTNAGNIVITSGTATNDGDITFSARGNTQLTDFNDVTNTDLAVAYTATSIVGAFNEIAAGGIVPAETLAQTLTTGNLTGGTDISVSTGDSIIGVTDLDLLSNSNTGASGDNVNITSGSTDTATGGAISIVAGPATTTGTGGSAYLLGGSGNNAAGGGGEILIRAGQSVSGIAGNVTVQGGITAGGTGGNAELRGGNDNASVAGGDVLVQGGNGRGIVEVRGGIDTAGGTAGAVTVQGGEVTVGVGTGGAVNIIGGDTVGPTIGGDVNLIGGNANGDITFQARSSATIPFNEAAPDNDFNSAFFSGSVMGVINEIGLGSNYFYVNNVTDFVSAIATGGKILLSPGTFSLSATQVLSANTQICGSGIGQTIITIDNALDLPAFTLANNVRFENLIFDGNGVNQTAVTNFANATSVSNISFNNIGVSVITNYTDCLLFTDCTNVKITNCEFTTDSVSSADINFVGSAPNGGSELVVSNCTFNQTNGALAVRCNQTDDILISKLNLNGTARLATIVSERVTISDCILPSSPALSAIILSSTIDAIVKGCSINITTAFDVIALSNSSNISITNNNFNNVNTATYCITISQCEGIVISNNNATNCVGFIKLSALSSTVGNDNSIIVNSNTFNGDGSSGSVFFNSTIAAATAFERFKLNITNNIVDNINDFMDIVSTATSNAQVDILVSNNKAETPNTGNTGCIISIPGANNTLTIQGNHIKDFQTAIDCVSYAYINIHGNDLIGSSAVSNLTCIQVGVGGANTALTVHKNTIGGYTTNAISFRNVTDEVSICDNILRGITLNTMNIIAQSLTVDKMLINNNNIKFGSILMQTNIQITKLIISNNNFVGASAGNPIILTQSSAMDLIISDNNIDDYDGGITLTLTHNSTKININNNIISNTRLDLLTLTATAASLSCRITGNEFNTSTSNNGITLADGNYIISNNSIQNCNTYGIQHNDTITGLTVMINDNLFADNTSNFNLIGSNTGYNVQNNNATIFTTIATPTPIVFGVVSTLKANYELTGGGTSFLTDLQEDDAVQAELVIFIVNTIISNTYLLTHIDNNIPSGVSISRCERITIDPYNSYFIYNALNGTARITIPDISEISAGHVIKFIFNTPPVGNTNGNWVSIVPTSYENGSRFNMDLNNRTEVSFIWTGVAWKDLNYDIPYFEAQNLTEGQLYSTAITNYHFTNVNRNQGGFRFSEESFTIRAGSSSTGIYEIIVPNTGVYNCTFSIEYVNANRIEARALFYVNGTAVTTYANFRTRNATSFISTVIFTPFYLSAGDTVGAGFDTESNSSIIGGLISVEYAGS